MIFALVCFGIDRQEETMNILNDLRNLEYNVYLITNIDLHLEHFQFNNVIEKRVEGEWNDFERYKIIKTVFDETDEEYVYYIDCDSRFIDFRKEKFNSNKFESLLNSINFDILFPFLLNSTKFELVKPDENENKEIRNFKFGYDSVINYFKTINDNYDIDIEKGTPIETALIFKRSEKIIDYLNEMINFSKILIYEDTLNNRKQKACASGFAMGLLARPFNVCMVESPITYHFFKGNFKKEIYPYNKRIDINEKIFLE